MRSAGEDWSEHYQAGRTPWDIGGPHPELVKRLPELGPPGTALVPGAGRGHDAAALQAAGWDVTAIDFAPAVEPALRRKLGEAGKVVIANVFGYRPPAPVDLVFDHTFFCAVPPAQRPEFGRWCRQVVRPGGAVASVVFPVGRPAEEGGPPFGVTVSDLSHALGSTFRLEVDEPAASVAGRTWPSRWAVLRRVGD